MSISSVLSSGSQIKLYTAMYAPLYPIIMSILGNTGTILSMGDPYCGLPNAASFTSVGAEQAVFNENGGAGTGWATFDGHDALADSDTFPYIYKGIIPIIDFNGTDEYFEINADAAYWSRGNGTVDYPFSIGMWHFCRGSHDMISKFDNTTGSKLREWKIYNSVTDKITFLLNDESVDINIHRTADAAITLNTWIFIVATYDGGGGSTAANGMAIYLDGSLAASTADNDVSYVAMEDSSTKVCLGASTNTSGDKSSFVDGQMAGGPLGPFYVQKELTADDVKLLYEIGRRALAL